MLSAALLVGSCMLSTVGAQPTAAAAADRILKPKCVQAELDAAKQTGELLRTQIVTKVKAVAAHEKRAERMESQLVEAMQSQQDLQRQLQVGLAPPKVCWTALHHLPGLAACRR